MKKTLSIIFAILMIVTTVPFVFAAEDGFVEVSTEAEMLAALENGGNIMLTGDITVSDEYWCGYEITKNTTIDLNGHTITGEHVFTPNHENAGVVLTIFGNGTFKATDPNNDMPVDVWGTLNLLGGTIEGYTNVFGTINMYGGWVDELHTDKLNSDDDTSHITGGYVKALNCWGGIVTISGGHVEALGIKYGTIIISGGTFGFNPTAYLAEGYTATEANGIWVVTCADGCNFSYTDNEDGTHIGNCTKCGYEVIEEHTLETVEAKAPTCTEIGWDAYEYCTACDYTTYVELPVDTDAHDWSNKDGICARENCGYECVHANYADGACDNCDVKQKYTVRMETKLSKGVEFVGNPVAIHGEDLIIEFKNLVSEKCNDVSLFELTIGANSFYEFEFDENGITFDGTVLTIPGELVNGDVETHANAYTQARIKLNGGKFSPECPPDIVEEYFIENDYAISNKMLVGYNNSVKDTFVKDKHTIKSILASDGNDYNKIYYFSPNSDLEMTIEWECLPENFENGVCVECGYECPHEWSEGSLVRPTRTEEGCYTYTCSICKDTKIELVERPANYAEFKELLEKVKGYLDENLTDSMMQEVNNIINFFDLDENHRFIKGEENTVSQNIRQISEFVEVVEEGIADGTAVKVDGFTVYNERGREWLLKFADEGIFEKARELILNSTEVKAKMDEIYDFALSLEGNVAENAENIAKIEADVDEFFGQLKKCVYGIHNVSQYKEISPAKCGENAVESATCTLCGETVTREVENSALKHSFTKYEVTEEAKCGVEGKEVAYCDNGCGETDEKEIEALRHSFTKYETVEEAKCGVEGKEVATCDNGCGETDEKAIEALRHSFTKYEETEAPKCGVEGKEVATCDHGCGKTDEKAIEALTHTDADGDYICDHGCGYEYEKPAPEEPTPDTPDEPTDDACDHLCHKSGILGFFWKIVKFFSKLFKINPVCECGVAHY